MASGYESLSQMELRKKLLEYGYDMPVSVKKEFMVKVLEKAVGEGKRKVTRHSLPPSVPLPQSNNNNRYETESNASSHSRKSTGSRASRASLPATVGRREAPMTPLQPRVVANASPIVEDFDEEPEDFEDGQEEMYTQEDDSQESQGYRPSIKSTPPSRLQEPEDEDDDEDEENQTPSPRYERYISYFKSNNQSDPFVMPRSQYASPAGSPFSTVANAGSPSFRQRSFDVDDSADESDNDDLLPSAVRRRGVGAALNPRNWMPSFNWLRRGSRGQGQDHKQNEEVNFNFGSGNARNQGSFNFGSGPVAGPSRMATPGTNGHFGSPSARLANQIYSPAAPPSNPGLVAGRQAGFTAFFGRGERNGINYGNNGPRESSTLIPKLLLVGFVVMVFAVLGTYYYKTVHGNGNSAALPMADDFPFSAESGPIVEPPGQEDSPTLGKKSVPITTLVYPGCGAPGYDEPFCIPLDSLKGVEKLFYTLINELTQRTKDKYCGYDVQDKISLKQAKSLLSDLTPNEMNEDNFNGLLMLITENPVMNMKLDRDDESEIKIQEVQTLDHETTTVCVRGVSPGFVCSLLAIFYLIVNYMLFFLLATVLGFTGFRVWKWLKQKKTTEEEELFTTIDKIVDLLQRHYEETKNTDNNQSGLAVSHIRDMMFGPRERKQKEKLWKRVVEEIRVNDSRIREEIQHISGEEFPVWRWLPSTSPLSSRMSMGSSSPSSPIGPAGDVPIRSPKLYPNLSRMSQSMESGEESNSFLGSPGGSRWQGQAFEIFDGSPNSLQQPPSTCLKIRQMFANARELTDYKIEQSILEKCVNSKILHIGIDRNNREGAVYIRCFSKADAANAYREMHGWWYGGHLLSVKFLREERYFVRFPEAQRRTTPLSLSNFVNNVSSPVQSFGGQ